MSGNVISLLITAQDRVSDRLAAWVPKWKGLAASASQGVGSGIGEGLRTGLNRELSSGDLFQASLLGNLGANAVTAALGAATAAVEGFKSSVGTAMDSQISMLSNANDLANALAVPYERAKVLSDEIAISVSEMAANLPGSNADFTAVAQGIQSVIGQVNRGDLKEFAKDLEEVTRGAGLLAVKSGVAGEAAGSTIQRFISGLSTFGELRQLDLFQKSPAFVTNLTEAAEQLGLDMGEGFKEASAELRLQVLQAALSRSTPQELVEDLQETASGYLEGMRSKLLDQQTGMFGFLRKIPALNGRSVIDAITGFLKEMSELGAAFGRITQTLGFDPLVPLINGIDTLTGFLDNVGNWLSGLDIAKGLPENLQIDWSATAGVLANFGDWLAGAINAGVETLNGWLMSADWGTIGANVYSAGVTALGALGNVLIQIDWGQVGMLLLNLTTASIQYLGGAIGRSFETLAAVGVAAVGSLGEVLTSGLSRVAGAISATIDRAIASIPVVGQVYQAGQTVRETAQRILTPSAGEATPPAVGRGAPQEKPLTFGLQAPADTKTLPQPLATAGGFLPLPQVSPQVAPQAYTFSPTNTFNVHATPGMDVETIAEKTASHIANQWKTFQSATLSR